VSVRAAQRLPFTGAWLIDDCGRVGKSEGIQKTRF
jgi:hypothetical protein